MKHTKLRWVSNMYKPKKEQADAYVARKLDTSQIKTFLGEPKANKKYTSLQLVKMGMVGVYVLQEVSDELSN